MAREDGGVVLRRCPVRSREMASWRKARRVAGGRRGWVAEGASDGEDEKTAARRVENGKGEVEKGGRRVERGVCRSGLPAEAVVGLSPEEEERGGGGMGRTGAWEEGSGASMDRLRWRGESAAGSSWGFGRGGRRREVERAVAWGERRRGWRGRRFWWC